MRSAAIESRKQAWPKRRNILMSPFIHLENSPSTHLRSSPSIGLPLITRKSRAPLREREGAHSMSPVKTNSVSMPQLHQRKRRYFYLNDCGSIYDISGKSVCKVRSL